MINIETLKLVWLLSYSTSLRVVLTRLREAEQKKDLTQFGIQDLTTNAKNTQNRGELRRPK